MKRITVLRTIPGLLFFTGLSSGLFAKQNYKDQDSLAWATINKKEYTVHYTDKDKGFTDSIASYLQTGIDHVSKFYGHSFLQKFDVYVFPDRNELNKQWQKDWGDPGFQSECWMVASGVAHRLDILSPAVWKNETCDHNANDPVEVRQIIWHELTHVFHGQYNPDHTFSHIENLDWLAEGIATYVSGQLDDRRLQRVKQLVPENKTPSTLDDFWKGREKYGLSGSIVAFIDKKFGREKLFELLTLISKQDVLKSLSLTEDELLKEWKESF